MNHWRRHAGHERINHMTVPEYMGRDLPSGELLPARDLLDDLQERPDSRVMTLDSHAWTLASGCQTPWSA
jgi:hypothetical protein